MKAKAIQEKDVWNKWVQENNGSFLESWQWGSFQYTYGRDVEYVVVEDQGKIIAGTILIKYALPASRFYYFSPYGPVQYHQALLEYIRDKANKEKIIFWRYENQTGDEPVGQEVKEVHPKTNLVLKLDSQDEQALLKNMKSKTRYNIKLAEKKGVTTRVSEDMSDIDIFYDLISDTARRQKIGIHPKSYYQTMIHSLGDSGFCKIYIAEYEGKALAANLMVFFNDTVTYLHGGTSHEHRETMAPYALQWRAICDALQHGYKYYDFFGIADTDDPQHGWAGITRFKKGFSGDIKKYAGTYEMPLNNLWYKAYKLSKKIKK